MSKALAPTLIDLLRHGEPVGGRKYRGKIDDPLSEKGWQQMRHAASGLTPWDNIISSPLKRCSEFAEELGQQLSIPVKIHTSLAEIGFGIWEGKSGAELKSQDSEVLKRFYHAPVKERPSGAERLADFHQRIKKVYQEILGSRKNQHTLVIAHAGVIRAFICTTLQAREDYMFRINVDSAHLSRIRVNEERPATLMFHGRAKL